MRVVGHFYAECSSSQTANEKLACARSLLALLQAHVLQMSNSLGHALGLASARML